MLRHLFRPSLFDSYTNFVKGSKSEIKETIKSNHYLNTFIRCITRPTENARTTSDFDCFEMSCVEGSAENILYLYNSLTRKKEPFFSTNGRSVTWYCCGPTVYDSAHMGHARSYITFDILRRVLSDYFNYDIIYIMNITDIDDKIITRARKEFIWNEFLSQTISKSELLTLMKESVEYYQKKISSTTDSDLRSMRTGKLEKMNSILSVLQSDQRNDFDPTILNSLKDVLSDYYDNINGSNITDHSIFSKLTTKYENEFLKDMKSLNILSPTFMPRVTEYISIIIDYITKIIDNGYAYLSNESVYFDIQEFSKKHTYLKLVPEAASDISTLMDGEGELTASFEKSEKRSPRDFVLWKKSKSGEPSWNSPWGKGRPGWHIECSAMGSDIAGEVIDIHSGGVDLKFPHHDNELAQSEAFFENHRWIRYFLHCGHLTIDGCKMSKSLKNFVTIQDALKSYTSRQIRCAFLMHHWNGPLDYSQSVMSEALNLEKKINDFFSRLTVILKENEAIGFENNVYGEHEKNLKDIFLQKKKEIHESLCNNVDTASCMIHLRSLISAYNNYLSSKSSLNIHILLIKSIGDYVFKILNVFGTTFDWNMVDKKSLDSWKSNDYYELAEAVSNFRWEVRKQAIKSQDKNVLELCDSLRDKILLELGVKIEDRGNDLRPMVILGDSSQFIRERDALLSEQDKKNKAKSSIENPLKEVTTHPSEIFRSETDKYSKFDESGFPTHDKDGVELTKSAVKKIQKRYQAYLKRFNKSSNVKCEN